MTMLLGGALAACGGTDGSQVEENEAAPAPILQESSAQLANHTIRVYKGPD